jgi:membrane protein YdbS with pleckstrin-like domain
MADEEGYNFLNPKSKSVMYIKYGIAVAVLIAAAVILFVFRKDVGISDIAVYAAIAGAAILSIVLLAMPTIFYRHYRYIVDTEKVDVHRGVLFITRTVVPIERIHQVEVKRGPISNALGLADVVITTAGGSAAIQYLEFQVAQSIADYLNDTVNKIIRDRETE